MSYLQDLRSTFDYLEEQYSFYEMEIRNPQRISLPKEENIEQLERFVLKAIDQINGLENEEDILYYAVKSSELLGKVDELKNKIIAIKSKLPLNPPPVPSFPFSPVPSLPFSSVPSLPFSSVSSSSSSSFSHFVDESLEPEIFVSDPNMSSEQTLDILEANYVGEIKLGLQALKDTFLYRAILPDGHCLFRAIGASLALSINQANANEKMDMYNNIEASVENLKTIDPELSNLWMRSKSLLMETLKGDEASVIDVMDRSDILVQFLRHLACSKLQQGHPYEFDLTGTLEGRTLGKYIKDMENMDSNTTFFGGEAEITALSKALDCCIYVLKPEAIGKNLIKDPIERSNNDLIEIHNKFNEKSGGFAIYLLHYLIHYDLAIKRQ